MSNEYNFETEDVEEQIDERFDNKEVDQNPLLREIISNIEEGISDIEKNLRLLSIEKISVSSSNNLLIILLTIAEKSNNIECVPYILTRWSQTMTGFDEYVGPIYPILASLFTMSEFPRNLLQLIHKSISNDVPMVEIALDIFHQDGGPQSIFGLNRLFDIFGRPDGSTYRFLYNEALETRNDAALEYISSFQDFYRNPSKKPDYIIDTGDELIDEKDLLNTADLRREDILPSTIDEYINDIDYLSEYMITGLNLFNFDIESNTKLSSKQKIKKLLESKTEEERKHILQIFANQERNDKLNSDPELFLILGPSNPLVGTMYIDNTNICFRYGGCRMYHCNCFEYNNEEKEDLPYYPNIPTWFKGYCEVCQKEIIKRIYSVRQPLTGGGWLGTYCSWDCLKKKDNGAVLDDEMTKILIRRAEEDLNEINIIDRFEVDIEEELKNESLKNPSGTPITFEALKFDEELNQEKQDEEDEQSENEQSEDEEDHKVFTRGGYKFTRK